MLISDFERALRPIAIRSVKVWFNHGRLDDVLADVLGVCPHCELVYAIDVGGRQVSSNIHRDRIDSDAYHQDLSQRPIAVSLQVLSGDTLRGAFACDTYISRVTRRSCVTLMYCVRSNSDLLGFIAADFDPAAVDARGG